MSQQPSVQPAVRSMDIKGPAPTARPNGQAQKSPPKSRRKFRLLSIVLVALLVIGVAVLVAITHKKAANMNDVHTVINLVSKHYLLPSDEVPALATITDPSKISTKFLKKTQTGDKLLIYQKNSRVIIYRPSIDRIVDVGPVEITPLQGNQ
jgi:hypothetical protein